MLRFFISIKTRIIADEKHDAHFAHLVRGA
jgi:hypothetical protein